MSNNPLEDLFQKGREALRSAITPSDGNIRRGKLIQELAFQYSEDLVKEMLIPILTTNPKLLDCKTYSSNTVERSIRIAIYHELVYAWRIEFYRKDVISCEASSGNE